MSTTIIIPRATKDGWYASLSNGKTVWQDEPGGGLQSAWWRLKELCDRDKLQITALKVVIGNAELHIHDCNAALGFWQAQRLWAGADDYKKTGDPDWHWRGIGYVYFNQELKGHIVEAVWVAYPHAPYQEPYGIEMVPDPHTGKPVAKRYIQHRIAKTESQVIWKPGVTPIVPGFSPTGELLLR